MNGEPEYADGIKDERARCETIMEFWAQPAYIAVRFGPIDDAGMKVLLKAVELMEEDIASGCLPNRS